MSVNRRFYESVCTYPFPAFCSRFIAGGELDFLREYVATAEGSHSASLLLRAAAFGITVLSASVAAIEKWRPQWKGAIIWISLLVATLTFGSTMFFSDFKTYEKAYDMYDTEIKSFKASYEGLDLADRQMVDEFRTANLELIERLQGIRLGLIEGNLQANFVILPLAYAQEPSFRNLRPRDTLNFLYSNGYSG